MSFGPGLLLAILVFVASVILVIINQLPVQIGGLLAALALAVLLDGWPKWGTP